MSEENRPNLNAVGLLDIFKSIEKHKRGQAGQEPNALRTSNSIRDFVESINDILDNEFGEWASLDRNGD